VRRVKNTYLRRSSIEEDNHPLAQYYRELLEAALSKYRVALMAGAWEVGVALLAARQEDVERGMALLAGIFSGEKSVPRPIRVLRGPTSRNGSALLPSTVLNTPDLALLVQLPQEEMPGYQVFPDARFAVALPQRSLPPAQGQGRSIAIGKVLDRAVPTGQWLELDVEDLAKHAFVTGVTGSGKTESCLFLLDQLWRNHHIPFLVIEPAKQEYRVFKDCSGFQGFKLFTLGDER
jgi:Cdc6-like AAA superfamily ATPase